MELKELMELLQLNRTGYQDETYIITMQKESTELLLKDLIDLQVLANPKLRQLALDRIHNHQVRLNQLLAHWDDLADTFGMIAAVFKQLDEPNFDPPVDDHGGHGADYEPDMDDPFVRESVIQGEQIEDFKRELRHEMGGDE